MANETRYREIEVGGDAYQMGRQIGEAAGDEVRGFCEVALQRLDKTLSISGDKARSLAARCIEHARGYRQAMVDELQGIADATGVSLVDMMLLQVRNQVRPEADTGCTSFSLAAMADAQPGPCVAQNWDNDPALDEFTVVLTRRPTGKPALMNVTQAGLIAYIGFNDAGIGACLNTLPAPSREVGVPHYFTLRGIYEATSLEGAIQAVQGAERAIPANIMLATPQGPADLEVTLDDVYVLVDEGSGRVTHTNHCLHRDLIGINDDFPELIQSQPRKRRIDELLANCGQDTKLDGVQSLLSDHQGFPRSICRHSNDDPDTGFWQTVFSVVIEPNSRQMHVSRGTPCDHPYEIYRLN